jgi:hypothetical protein
MRIVHAGIGGLVGGFLVGVAWFALLFIVMMALDWSDPANRDGTIVEQYVVLCQFWLLLAPVAMLFGCWSGGKFAGDRWDQAAG